MIQRKGQNLRLRFVQIDCPLLCCASRVVQVAHLRHQAVRILPALILRRLLAFAQPSHGTALLIRCLVESRMFEGIQNEGGYSSHRLFSPWTSYTCCHSLVVMPCTTGMIDTVAPGSSFHTRPRPPPLAPQGRPPAYPLPAVRIVVLLSPPAPSLYRPSLPEKVAPLGERTALSLAVNTLFLRDVL